MLADAAAVPSLWHSERRAGSQVKYVLVPEAEAAVRAGLTAIAVSANPKHGMPGDLELPRAVSGSLRMRRAAIWWWPMNGLAIGTGPDPTVGDVEHSYFNRVLTVRFNMKESGSGILYGGRKPRTQRNDGRCKSMVR